MTQDELTKALQDLQVKKSQAILMANIYFTGPFMLWLSFRNSPSVWEKRILRILGAGTIVYNFANYRKQLMKIQAITQSQNQLQFEEVKEKITPPSN
jgi:hypothetical protein